MNVIQRWCLTSIPSADARSGLSRIALQTVPNGELTTRHVPYVAASTTTTVRA